MPLADRGRVWTVLGGNSDRRSGRPRHWKPFPGGKKRQPDGSWPGGSRDLSWDSIIWGVDRLASNEEAPQAINHPVTHVVYEDLISEYELALMTQASFTIYHLLITIYQ